MHCLPEVERFITITYGRAVGSDEARNKQDKKYGEKGVEEGGAAAGGLHTAAAAAVTTASTEGGIGGVDIGMCMHCFFALLHAGLCWRAQIAFEVVYLQVREGRAARPNGSRSLLRLKVFECLIFQVSEKCF